VLQPPNNRHIYLQLQKPKPTQCTSQTVNRDDKGLLTYIKANKI